ncbi:hypothetical protein A9Q96_10285 [Rhodobacterales bacterium 52_120_T64]|nr:hypothetical protein A9Q96_10285 [Rhodobacterales bacterium 52_120_T64]
MQPNLTYITESGEILERVKLESALHLSSIRHLAMRQDGLVAFATQWQGDTSLSHPLLGFHKLGARSLIATIPERDLARMKGYIGSVSFSEDGHKVAVSSPQGGQVQLFNVTSLHTRAVLRHQRFAA